MPLPSPFRRARPDLSPASQAPRRALGRSAIALSGIALLVAGVVACTQRDTFYDLRTGEIFEPYGTQYDCRVASEKYGSENVWRGLVGGRQWIEERSRNISRELCFPSRGECEYWRAQMDGAMQRVITNSCTQGYRG